MTEFFNNYSSLINKRLGVLGGGQLGKMLATSAHALGIKVTIFSDEKECPASYVTNNTIIADYNDQEALLRLVNNVDVITLEFENIPTSTLDFLMKHTVLHPNSQILNITQDRLKEKLFVNNLGIATAKFEEVTDIDNITLDYPFILKTRIGGYDGKGQHLIRSNSDKVDIKVPYIAEQMVKFQKEISIIAACDLQKNIEFFPIVENVHKNGILCTSSVPANISNKVTAKAQEIAEMIIKKMNYVGVIAIELFLTEGEELLVNEMAPRVHNSGHWSIEACNVSQFEQHVRAVCGLPIKPVQLYFSCEVHNLIGNEVKNIEQHLLSPEKRVTIYGKKEIRDGRKMGHVTIPKL